MSDEDDLVRSGELGDRVAAFLETEVGEIIISAADRDESEAVSDLMGLDPYEYSSLGKLQSAVAKSQESVLLARKVKGYLADVIIAGQEADNILTSKEN